MLIGDVFMRVLADMKDFGADIVKKGGPAADKAGKTLGGKITKGIKGSFTKANLGQALTAGLGIGAGLGAVQLLTQALGGLVDGIKASVEAASNQREAMALTAQVFEENTSAIDEWARVPPTRSASPRPRRSTSRRASAPRSRTSASRSTRRPTSRWS